MPNDKRFAHDTSRKTCCRAQKKAFFLLDQQKLPHFEKLFKLYHGCASNDCTGMVAGVAEEQYRKARNKAMYGLNKWRYVVS